MNQPKRIQSASLALAVAFVVGAATPKSAAVDRDDRHPLLARFLRDLARAVPSAASDLAAIDVTVTPLPRAQAGRQRLSFGARHPDSGAPVCDHEALGVISADLATRHIAPIAVRVAGHAEGALRLAALPPITLGSRGAPSATVLFEAAHLGMSTTADARVGGRYRNALTGLAWALRNLGRSRAAPEESVLEAVVAISSVTASLAPNEGTSAVLDVARRTASAVVEAERHRDEAAARCAGSRGPGASHGGP